MKNRSNIFVDVVCCVVLVLMLAGCIINLLNDYEQEAIIVELKKELSKEINKKPTVITTTNEYETAELRSQIAYYKTSYENIKYDYDKLTAALGNWTEVIQGWLEQVNANYRR